MKKLIAALILSLSACGGTPASAYELETEDYFTNGSMVMMMTSHLQSVPGRISKKVVLGLLVKAVQSRWLHESRSKGFAR